MNLSLDPLNSLGYHYRDDYSLAKESNETIVHNVANFLGYWPGIGTIVGIARIIFSLYKILSENLDDQQKEFYRAEMYRGAVETLSLGIMFVVPDIIVTRARNISALSVFRL